RSKRDWSSDVCSSDLFKNNTNRYSQYDMIWFPQGIFVVITPSISHSTTGTTISLQLKDKMCLLNGECGGTIPASTQFDEYETIEIGRASCREREELSE